jgi:uncharacterized protein YbjQ (UPF0145 family)
MLIVTTDDLPGYQVRKVLGEAIGVTGRTRNPFQEGVRKLHGGDNPQLIQALTRWRLEAVEQMTAHALKLGANAVLGMRFDHRNVSDMWTEICAYGTAVYVVQLAPPPDLPMAEELGEASRATTEPPPAAAPA